MIDFETENEFKSALSPGERLLWCGKPKAGLLLRTTDWYLIPFSLIWGGFAIFWETMAFGMGAPLLFKLFGIPFVLIGLYMIFGPFFADARKRKSTFYGLTPDRIIIKSGIFSTSIQSISLKNINEVNLTEKSDNSGTISFGPLETGFARSSHIRGVDWAGVKQQTALDLIPDVKFVYDKIIELQRTHQEKA